MQSISISVVVCTHSELRWNDLRAALDSISRQTFPALETIVVVDHNLSLNRRLSEVLSGIRTVENGGSPGLSSARNAGVAVARGDVVAFIDDDATAAPDWLERIAAHFADPEVIAVGGSAMPRWPDSRPRWFPPEFDWVVGCSYRGLPARATPVRNLIGCNMSFRSGALAASGGFQEWLGRVGGNAAGAEETALCIKMHRDNPDVRIIYDPEIVVHHRVTWDRTRWKYFVKRCFAEGRSKHRLVALDKGHERLDCERQYATRTLPIGVFRALGDAVVRFDPYGVARAGAIVSGLATTVAGYASDYLGLWSARQMRKSFSPLKIVDLDVQTADIETALARYIDDGKYGGAFCLLRQSGAPVGVVEIPFDGDVPLLDAMADPSACTIVGDESAGATKSSGPPARASIIVATRDRTASLARCIDSLLKQDYPAFEIVVVDSAPSSAETAELIQSKYAPGGRVRYVREDRPGLGRAHNRGVSIVDSPLLAFTDDDVVADPHWLSALALNLTDERVGCVTGLILPAELETRAQYWTERHGGFGKGFNRKTFAGSEPPEHAPLFPYAAGQFGSGANMAFRAAALEKIGGFDPALGAGTRARGGDDLAAFFATIDAGYRIVYEPGAVVWHYHRRGEDGMRRQAFGYGVGLGAYLAKIVLDRPARLLRCLALVPAALVHLFSSRSGKNARLPPDYPRLLVWRERLGIAVGPIAYLRSRAEARRSTAPGTGAGKAARMPG